jgi:hypothetical protein
MNKLQTLLYVTSIIVAVGIGAFNASLIKGNF